MTNRLFPGILLLFSLAAPGGAQVQAKRKELSQIQQQLESTRREIDEYRKLEQSLGGELHKLESRNQEARHKMEQLQRNIRLAESRKTGLKSRLGALGEASGFWRSELEADARAYEADLASRSDAFGTQELWKESFRRGAIMEKAELMAGLQGISAKTVADEAATRRQAADLVTRSRKVAAEQTTRQQEYETKQAAMAETQQKKQEAIKRAVELEETAKALTKLIKTLGHAKNHGTASTVKLDFPRNSLAWPAQGAVVQSFGKERNEQLNTWVIHQGIRLATAPQAPVTAVLPGRVIFSGPFRSYGQVVIVDHGSGLFGVYGELGTILKNKGVDLASGEALGKAGDGGEGKGKVYFELRHGTEALDPLAWLGKR